MSTSSQKSSSSASRPRATGRIATPKGSKRPSGSGSLGSKPSLLSGLGKRKEAGLKAPSPAKAGATRAGGSKLAAPSLSGSSKLAGSKASGPSLSSSPKATRRAGSRERSLSLPKGKKRLEAPSAREQKSLGRRAAGKTASGRPLMAAPSSDGGRPPLSALSGLGSPKADGQQKAPKERSGRGLGVAFGVAVGVGVLALVAVVVLLVLSQLPVFVIQGIDAQASEHVSAETIAKLAAVEEGTTLLSVDVGQVQESVKQNPWVKKVNVTREFPDKLGISVEERDVWAVAVIGSGSSVWALGEDGVWIEPIKVDSSETGDVTSAALAKAKELGCLLIADLPASVNPAQSSEATDAVIKAVMTYQQEFTTELSAQVQSYYASSEGSISMQLKSGLEVSLGSPTDISSKQAALTEVMNNYPNQLTYVNVRVPTNPSYRKVSGDSLTTPTSDDATTDESSGTSSE